MADRQIVSWSLADSMDAEATTIVTWEKACTRRRPGDELLFHSDQGLQYAAAGFTELLEAEQVTQSMSRRVTGRYRPGREFL